MSGSEILTGDLPAAEQGLIPKVATASWQEINARDGMELTSILGTAANATAATKFGKGLGLKWLGPVGAVVGGTAGAVVGGMDASSQFKKEQDMLDIKAEEARSTSSAAEEGLREKNKKIVDSIGDAGASTLGATIAGAGAVAGTAILLGSNPVGWVAGLVGIGGSIVGGIGGSKAYDALLKSETKDAMSLVAKIRYAQDQGVDDMPPEAIAGALFASMPEHMRKKIEDKLEEKTGTRSFHEAVKKEKYKELRELMTEYDLDIRTQTGILFNPENPQITAAEQLTQLINTRQLDARALIFDKDNMPILQAMQKAEETQTQMLSNNPPVDIPADTSNFKPFPPGDDNQPPKSKSFRDRV
jgi:hypothetical protein